jgi:hypothetical protein
LWRTRSACRVETFSTPLASAEAHARVFLFAAAATMEMKNTAVRRLKPSLRAEAHATTDELSAGGYAASPDQQPNVAVH